MKGLIVYMGKYGATQQYANWIGKELTFPVVNAENLTPSALNEYDFVLVGSSVYFGKLLLRSWLTQNHQLLQKRKLLLFVVCATPSSEKEKQQKILRENLPASLLKSATTFFLPGRLEIKKLSWMDRLILKAAAKMEKDPAKANAMLHDIDGVKKENLDPLLETARTITGGALKSELSPSKMSA